MTILGWRMSLLDETQFCGLAGLLSQQHGTGREAVKSRAYHARLAGAPDAVRLMSGLTSEEADDVLEWKPPVDVVLQDIVLRYEDADKEVCVGLDALGDYVEPCEDADCVTVGHLDFAWVVERKGEKWAYVADLKRSMWTPSYDPESLQLHAYGRAFAKKWECVGYITGCWAAIEGVWRWSRDAYRFDEIGTDLLWNKIYYAATNKDERGCTGPHCQECFGRTHCPEYLLPAAFLDTPLSIVCQHTADGVVPSPEKARECLDLVHRMETLAKAAKDQLKAMVKAGVLQVLDEEGRKQWAPVERQGRLKLDEEKLEAKLGDLAPYKVRGAPYDAMQWVKVGTGR